MLLKYPRQVSGSSYGLRRASQLDIMFCNFFIRDVEYVAEDPLKARDRGGQPLDIDCRETGRFAMKPDRNIRARVDISVLLYQFYLTTACRRPMVPLEIG